MLEAELEGAIAVLPEAVLPPSGTGAAAAEGLVSSLHQLWDLDTYILLLRCYTGIVSVRPADVGVSIGYGTPVSGARLDSSELKRQVGSHRIITRRTPPGGGAESTMRHQLVAQLAAAAAAGNSSAVAAASSAAASVAAPDLAAALTQLAMSTRVESQLTVAMLQHAPAAAAPSSTVASKGAGGRAAARSPADAAALATSWFDHLWRTHRRALVPSPGVASLASLALKRLRDAAAAFEAESKGEARRVELFSARLLHDSTTAAAAATAAAQLLGKGGQLHPPSTAAVDELELDSSGEVASPVRVIETIHQLSADLSKPSGYAASKAKALLLLTPSELPALPLVIAAAWSKQLAAFSLPMLLQNASAPNAWQPSLVSSLRPLYSATGIESAQRWMYQATELVLHVYAPTPHPSRAAHARKAPLRRDSCCRGRPLPAAVRSWRPRPYPRPSKVAAQHSASTSPRPLLTSAGTPTVSSAARTPPTFTTSR